jgi:hypothetical protein
VHRNDIGVFQLARDARFTQESIDLAGMHAFALDSLEGAVA